MGLINIYNTISDEHTTKNATGKIKDIFPDYDFTNTLLLKAGERVTPDYMVTEEDVLYMRITPTAISTVVAALLITGTVVAAGVVIGAGISAYVDAKTKEAQEKAQRDAQNLAQQINQLPFIKGSNNKSALGNAVQFVMGDVYNSPYKTTDGFYTVENGDLTKNEYGYKTYFNMIGSLGFGDQKVREILCGTNSLIKNSAGISSGVHSIDSDSVFYDPSNKIELRQSGENFSTPVFAQKVICTVDGNEIKHDYGEEAEPLIKTLADYTQKVEICIQINGLRYYDQDSSNWKKRKITVRPYWTNKDNPSDSDWNEFYFTNMTDNTIELNTNKTIRFVASKTFTASQTYGKTIKIKLVKETAKMETNSNEECYLQYYQSFCYDNAKSSSSSLVACSPLEDDLNNMETRFAVRLIANDNTKELLNEFHALTCGKARTYNGTSWSTTKTATRNPASWILEILTSPVHNHSKFSDSEIDLVSLGRLYTYCNTNNFYTDGILTAGVKKRDLISKILSTVNADMIINADGKFEFVIDQIEETPVALINSENISSITYSKDLTRKPDGLKVTFTNRENWQIDTFYSMMNNKTRTQSDSLTEVNFDYVTTYDHAFKMAQRKMRQQILQPREIMVDVGREGDFYPLYSTVMLQYSTFRQGLNSSTIAGLITSTDGIEGIEITDAVIFESSKQYGVIIQAQTIAGKKLYYKKVSGSGKTRELMFDSPIELSNIIPQKSNLISFGELDEDGEFDKITNVMKITGIKSKENGLSLTLKDYNPAIYETGEIPPFKSNITEPPKPTKEIPAPTIITGTDGENGKNAFTYRGVFKSLSELPADAVENDFLLCGNNIVNDENILTDTGEDLLADSQNSLVAETVYKKGFVYTCNSRGDWNCIENKNDYRYIICVNDSILMDQEISPALNEGTVGKVFEETGIDALEDKKIIDEDKKTIKADLIDADAIFTKQLTIKNNGSIQSANYSADTGFKISANGNAEFNKGRFRAGIGKTEIIARVDLETKTVEYFIECNGEASLISVYYNTFGEAASRKLLGLFLVTRSLTPGGYWYNRIILYQSDDVIISDPQIYQGGVASKLTYTISGRASIDMNEIILF